MHCTPRYARFFCRLNDFFDERANIAEMEDKLSLIFTVISQQKLWILVSDQLSVLKQDLGSHICLTRDSTEK